MSESHHQKTVLGCGASVLVNRALNRIFASAFVHNESNGGAASIGAQKVQPRIIGDCSHGGRFLPSIADRNQLWKSRKIGSLLNMMGL